MKIKELQTALDKMHKEVQASVSTRRDKAVEKHNRATNIVTPSFSIGDFVLVRQATDRGHKLRFKWFGPCRITAVHGPLVYGVTSLSTRGTQRVHAARLIKYNDSLNGAEVPQEVINLADNSESRYEVVSEIVDIGQDKDEIWFRVIWDGLPDERDWT